MLAVDHTHRLVVTEVTIIMESAGMYHGQYGSHDPPACTWMSHSLRLIRSKVFLFSKYCITSKRRHGYYLFQRYHNTASIRGRCLFTAATIYFSATTIRRLFEGGAYSLRLLFISALPQCGVYSRAVLIRGRCLILLWVHTCNLCT